VLQGNPVLGLGCWFSQSQHTSAVVLAGLWHAFVVGVWVKVSHVCENQHDGHCFCTGVEGVPSCRVLERHACCPVTGCSCSLVWQQHSTGQVLFLASAGVRV
jgi:hypothetical protein